ncbi:hypothetical protein PHYPSEUDO_002342 [Phytophthora pseudosyringae]|uniref:FHA domain-containing protein n=1 Tax=Phytophthora pseudosyringae TaxID=221518 RepID=A0A8T1WHX1_9STRA|nr:hypothetical protein PHYPSEUDO_002342 [Phytophthora pseudosyringae]
MQVSSPSMATIVFALLVVVVAVAPLEDPVQQDEQTWLKKSLVNVPSLRLQVTLKGKNLKIHGQSTVDVFVNPVVSAEHSTLRYDGSATFIQDGTKFTYMFVNGTSYMVESSGNTVDTVRCLQSILPFENMLPALNNAIPTPSASISGEAVECPSGSLFRTSFSRVDFVLCASGASGFIAYGLDVTIAVVYLSSPIQRISALIRTDEIGSCPVVATPTQVTTAALSLLTGELLPHTASRTLKAAAPVAIQVDRCECKSTPRPCIFLHGLGNPNEEPELQDTPELTKAKFGNIGDHAPCCLTVKYAVMNTVDYGWTNDTLQQKFCDFSLSMSETSDLSSRTISNTIVVTHSMGGLVMASALATGKCNFAETTSWVSLSAPMTGSMAGDYIQDLCDDGVSSVEADLIELVGQCPASAARKSVSYQGEKYSTATLNAAYTAAQTAYRGNVTAAMCSNYYDGVVSKYQLLCIAGGEVIPHKSRENDGLVEFQSCLGGLDPALFGTSYLDRFYKPELNHADTAFLTHDGLFEDSKKPFKWFECLL